MHARKKYKSRTRKKAELVRFQLRLFFGKRLSDATQKGTRFAEFFKKHQHQHTIFQQLLFRLHIWQTKASNGSSFVDPISEEYSFNVHSSVAHMLIQINFRMR